MNARPDQRLAQRGGWIELLRAPACLFGAIARARSVMYSRRLLPSYDVGPAVVSVGNVVAGGTGKTPMIVWLARELEGRGLKVGIVSRGYRAPAGAAAAAESSAETSAGESVEGENCNDEARMLADMLPGVLHVQDRDRVAAGQRLAEAGIDVVLVDDGFQHRRLARDVDIVLVDALRPFGLPAPDRGGEPVEAMLPRGLMREPLSALRRANAIVLTRVDAVSEETVVALERRLRAAAPGVPIAHGVHRPTGLRVDGHERPLADLDGAEVDLFSGIGNPGAFERTAAGLGARISSHRAFGDHHNFTTGDLDGLGVQRPALTTAKDAARLTLQPDVAVPAEMWVLDVELSLESGADELRALLDGLPESQAGRKRASMHEGLHG